MAPIICLVTGPAGSGKSTIAEQLARSFPKSARIDVDYIRHTIRSGKVRPFPYTKEAKSQVKLAIQNTCDLAKNFTKAGFSVFIDDVVVLKENLDLYFKNLHKHNFFAIVLLPNKTILEQRDIQRGKQLAMGTRALQLHDEFSKQLAKEKRWHIIDTSKHTVEQTTKEILKLLKTA